MELTEAQHPGLDPRLRRVLATSSEVQQVRSDISRSIVQADVVAEDLSDDASLDDAALRVRVLVQLSADAGLGVVDRWSPMAISDQIFVIELPLDELAELVANPAVEYVEAGRAMGPDLNAARQEVGLPALVAARPAATGAGVIVGIVDFGLDYTLADFRKPDGSTRVLRLWDQTLTPTAGEASPQGFPFGVEYHEADINNANAAADPFAVVRHQPGPASHGTHVCGIAAGNGSTSDGLFLPGVFIGAAPEADIVFVQPDSSDATGSFTDSVNVAAAVSYIFGVADSLGKPCVINMSLGQAGGSHDGESIVERAIDRLLEQPGRAMTVAAGNEHVWHGHAAGVVATGQTRELSWRVSGPFPFAAGGGPDRSPNELEIWYDPIDVFEVRIISPSGRPTQIIGQNTTVLEQTLQGNSIFVDHERFTRLNGKSRIYVEISPAPAFAIEAGTWRVELRAVDCKSGHFDGWIERDVRSPQNAFSDQSVFADADFDGTRTLGTPATCKRAIAVANQDAAAGQISGSSSRGPTGDGRNKPELAAPGTNIVASCALAGRLLQGQLLPARIQKSGTSMAAPLVAGTVALLLGIRPTLTAAQIRWIVAATAKPTGGAGPGPFDIAWGYGVLDAVGAVDAVDAMP